MRQKFIIFIILIGLISCSNNKNEPVKQYPKVQLRGNIKISDIDKQTGWNRVLLKEPYCWGYIDEDYNVKIPFVFKHIDFFDSLDMAFCQIGEKYGVINSNFDTIIPFIYDEFGGFDKGIVRVVKNNKHGYINRKGETIIPFIYNELRSFKLGLARAVKNNKHGYINREGKTIISFDYDDAHGFIDCGIAKVKKNGKWGFIDTTGQIIIPLEFDHVDYNPVDSFVLVTYMNKIAFFNKKGVQLSDFEFDKIYEGRHTDYSHGYTYMNNGLILVEKNKQKSFINWKMEEVISSDIYDELYSFEWPRMAIIRKDNKCGLLNEFGELVLQPDYNSIDLFPYGGNRYIVQKGQLYGVIDNKLKTIINTNYKDISANIYNYRPEKKGVFIIKNIKNLFGVTDFDGNVIIPFIYQSISEFEKHDNIVTCIVKKSDRYGIIDINGNIKLPIVYDNIFELDWFDYFIIELNNKFGIITKDGKIVVQIDYDSFEPCFYNKNDRFVVSKNGNFGVINRQNEIIIPLEYSQISNWVEYGPKEHFVVKDGKEGLIGRDGKTVIPPVYDKIYVDNRTLIKVENNGFYGTINWKNKIVHPIQYEQILWEWPFLTGRTIDTIYLTKSGEYFATDTNGKVIIESVSEKLINGKFGYLLINNDVIIIDE